MLYASTLIPSLAQVASATTYITLNFPGAVKTVAIGINDSLEIVGSYQDNAGNSHAFILSNGRFKSIQFSIPGETIVQSTASQIDDCGTIVGSYTDSLGNTHGFVLEGWGATTIDDPGSAFLGGGAMGINSAGEIVGAFCSATCYVGVEQGYALSSGVFTTLDFPGSDGPSGDATGINDLDQIIGQWEDTGGGLHGYKFSRGTYASIDVPNAMFTIAFGNNNAGQIVGWYGDSAGTAHGFLLVGKKFKTVDVPGVEPSGSAREQLYHINQAGDFVGYYVDKSGMSHGFVGLSSFQDQRMLLPR